MYQSKTLNHKNKIDQKNNNRNNNNNNKKLEQLSGLVERITYHNTENGFAVIKVNVKGNKDLVCVVGTVPSVSPGEYIQCSGVWHNDFNHGLQFKAEFLKAHRPTSLEGMEKYLGSGLIKGIGPHFAKKLVGVFGTEVFDVIENQQDKLTEVEGIGKVRAKRLCANWEEQRQVREIMVFLQSHGVGTTRATRIYKTYGEKAIETVTENPYKLARDIRGIGFLSADTIARNLDIPLNSIIRARAGINHVLLEATSEGHCGLPQKTLLETAAKLLEIEKTILQEAINKEVIEGSLTIDTSEQIELIFLTAYYTYEKQIATKLTELSQNTPSWGFIDATKAIPWTENKLNITLAPKQKLAIEQALNSKIMIITGGPGTGKTTIVNSILTILQGKKVKIKLCAPTGRAAKRLAESTGLEAMTIHRLLETNPEHGGFTKNEETPLECDYLVIDEASMVDVNLFCSLLKALPKYTSLLMVGDVDQLPSVGAGQVLADMINSEVFTTTKLIDIFRQAQDSKIITNAHLINQGKIPELTNKKDKDSDFYFIEAKETEEKELSTDVIEKLLLLVKTRIPNKFNFDPIQDIQVLCPKQRGGLGVRSINIELQKLLNPNYETGIEKYGQTFAIGDKIMQIENNHNNNIYNGDIGIIKSIDEQEQVVTIDFDNNEVTYEYTDLDQITLAYATTIHKSQGSEYPAIVIPITMQSYMMLKKNLLYTGITRGKKLVIIIGEKKAITLAVKNTKGLERYTKLKEWLVEMNKEDELDW